MESVLRKQIEEIVLLADDEFLNVLGYFGVRKYKKNQYPVQAGDLAPNDFFVTSGLIQSSYTDEQGKDHIVQFAPENWWISDPQSYHNGLTATLDLLCLEDTQTYFISLDNRVKLCADLRKMEYFFRKKTQAGYIALQRRIISLMSQSAKERYDQFVRLYPQLLQRVPKALIASYLGISRETLSRLS